MPERKINKPMTEWIVRPTEIVMRVTNIGGVAVEIVWDKDYFWKQLLEFKNYCEERGDIINGYCGINYTTKTRTK